MNCEPVVAVEQPGPDYIDMVADVIQKQWVVDTIQMHKCRPPVVAIKRPLQVRLHLMVNCYWAPREWNFAVAVVCDDGDANFVVVGASAVVNASDGDKLAYHSTTKMLTKRTCYF
jgi:hypothetical protein